MTVLAFIFALFVSSAVTVRLSSSNYLITTLTYDLAHLLYHQEAPRSNVLWWWALRPSPFLLVSRLDYRPSCHQRLRGVWCQRSDSPPGYLDQGLCFPCAVLSSIVYIENTNSHRLFSASSLKALLPLTPSLRQKVTFRRLSPLLGHFGPFLTTKRRASSTGPPSFSPSWPSSGSSKVHLVSTVAAMSSRSP